MTSRARNGHTDTILISFVTGFSSLLRATLPTAFCNTLGKKKALENTEGEYCRAYKVLPFGGIWTWGDARYDLTFCAAERNERQICS